jgi:hypothetical protein
MNLFIYPVFSASVPIELAQHAALTIGGILVAIPIALSVSLLNTTSPLTLVLIAGAVLFS